MFQPNSNSSRIQSPAARHTWAFVRRLRLTVWAGDGPAVAVRFVVGQLIGMRLAHPAGSFAKRLKVDNRRTRILTDNEQRGILQACRRKLCAIVAPALITGARIGELLALRAGHKTAPMRRRR
jgi:integrase